jgi:ABC-type antimicrobial peptide transport system permease subunit
MATQLNIREQSSLRWSKEIEIAVDGIHYRLLRSLLTLGVVVLAVAFITNILVEARIAGSCKNGVHALVEQQRELVLLSSFTDTSLGLRDLATRIADLPPGGWPLDTLDRWLGIPMAESGRFQADCLAWRKAERWLEERAPGHRRLLAGKRDIEETFALLDTDVGRRAFAETARGIPLQLPQEFLSFAARRRAFLAELEAATIRLNHARAAFSASIGGHPLPDWLVATEAGHAASILEKSGLKITPERLDSLRRRARDRDVERCLLARLDAPGLSVTWRKQFNQIFEKNMAIDQLASDMARAQWLLNQPAPGPLLTTETAFHAAKRLRDTRRLTEADNQLTAEYGNEPGLSANMFWLLIVSLLVCMAGITNAMLLSVIERFREIATMKCLGALNGFIARLFLLEAACLGLVGGLLGVLLGGTIGLVRMTFAYGEWVVRFFPWSGLAATAGIATACGLVLATLSALYPASSAARMPPIEAMRVE